MKPNYKDMALAFIMSFAGSLIGVLLYGFMYIVLGMETLNNPTTVGRIFCGVIMLGVVLCASDIIKAMRKKHD